MTRMPRIPANIGVASGACTDAQRDLMKPLMDLQRSKLRLTFSQHASRHARRIMNAPPARAGKIAFVEKKVADLAHVQELLSHCDECNQWANRGPLYWTLADAYHEHMNLPKDVSVTPCANGGIALEALARFQEIKAGRPLRWVASAFSFVNVSRGWFADAQLVDCDSAGMLDLASLQKYDPRHYDGLVVTNIFGIWRDFSPWIEFARNSGKLLLIDNAAGIDRQVPNWPYQSFSLHHTKPYGAGEGGLYLSPRDEAEEIYALLNYGPLDEPEVRLWLNNGKISDITCAFHLDRLARHADWARRYREQAARVEAIAASLGLSPLVPGSLDRPAMSRPFLAAGEIPVERMRASKKLHLGKYYQPLSDFDRAVAIHLRLVNIPTHPDVRQLNDEEIVCDLKMLRR
jgi:dTDP-4-amino-4,6-dideoxygalactose transaminase